MRKHHTLGSLQRHLLKAVASGAAEQVGVLLAWGARPDKNFSQRRQKRLAVQVGRLTYQKILQSPLRQRTGSYERYSRLVMSRHPITPLQMQLSLGDGEILDMLLRHTSKASPSDLDLALTTAEKADWPPSRTAAVIAALLDKGAKAPQASSEHQCPVWKVARLGWGDALAVLLSRGVLPTRPRHGEAAIEFLAAALHAPDMGAFMVALEWIFPLSDSQQQNLLRKALTALNPSAVMALLKCYPDLEKITPSPGELLHQVFTAETAVGRLSGSLGATRPPSCAVENWIQWCLSQGADPNALSQEGQRPLHSLTYAPEAIVPLLAHGADPGMPNAFGQLPEEMNYPPWLSEKLRSARHASSLDGTALTQQEGRCRL